MNLQEEAHKEDEVLVSVIVQGSSPFLILIMNPGNDFSQE
jgi:hypothetical protein